MARNDKNTLPKPNAGILESYSGTRSGKRLATMGPEVAMKGWTCTERRDGEQNKTNLAEEACRYLEKL